MTAHFVDLLDGLKRRSIRMASLVEDIVEEACSAILQGDVSLAQRVVERDRDVDEEEVQVESEVIRLLALYQPVGLDLRVLCTVLKVNNDLERVADCAVNVAERARHVEVRPLGPIYNDLTQMTPAVIGILHSAVTAYGSQDVEEAKSVFLKEDAVDALYGQIIRRVVAEAAESPARVASFLDVLSVGKNLERIADHATNIAEDVVYISTGEIVRHRKL